MGNETVIKQGKESMLNRTKEITMRHEEKYICSESQLRIIESNLRSLLDSDINQDAEGYEVRSVYFDTETDRMYEEGLDGLERRNKYRIRIYNGNSDVIKLEKKTSIRNLKRKKTALIEKDYVEGLLLNSEIESVLEYEKESLLQEFTMLRKTELLRPKAIVCYDRKAFVSDIGNIRITLDRNIRTTEQVTDFFEDNLLYHRVLPPHMHLLEVKYDGILPGYLVRVLNFRNMERTSFSKYVLSRELLKNNGRMSGLYEL